MAHTGAGAGGSCKHTCNVLGEGSGPCIYARRAPGARAGRSMCGTHRARERAGPMSICIHALHLAGGRRASYTYGWRTWHWLHVVSMHITRSMCTYSDTSIYGYLPQAHAVISTAYMRRESQALRALYALYKRLGLSLGGTNISIYIYQLIYIYIFIIYIYSLYVLIHTSHLQIHAGTFHELQYKTLTERNISHTQYKIQKREDTCKGDKHLRMIVQVDWGAPHRHGDIRAAVPELCVLEGQGVWVCSQSECGTQVEVQGMAGKGLAVSWRRGLLTSVFILLLLLFLSLFLLLLVSRIHALKYIPFCAARDAGCISALGVRKC